MGGVAGGFRQLLFPVESKGENVPDDAKKPATNIPAEKQTEIAKTIAANAAKEAANPTPPPRIDQERIARRAEEDYLKTWGNVQQDQGGAGAVAAALMACRTVREGISAATGVPVEIPEQNPLIDPLSVPRRVMEAEGLPGGVRPPGVMKTGSLGPPREVLMRRHAEEESATVLASQRDTALARGNLEKLVQQSQGK